MSKMGGRKGKKEGKDRREAKKERKANPSQNTALIGFYVLDSGQGSRSTSDFQKEKVICFNLI